MDILDVLYDHYKETFSLSIVVYIIFCINCSHRILSPFSFDNQLQS